MKIFEGYSCDYETYFLKQAGGEINYKTNLPNQRGYNWFGRNLGRYGHYVKPTLKYLGKKLYNVGVDVIRDVAEGSKLREAFKKQLPKTGKEIAKELFTKGATIMSQTGSLRKRRRRGRNKIQDIGSVVKTKRRKYKKNEQNREKNENQLENQEKKSNVVTKKFHLIKNEFNSTRSFKIRIGYF
jgi:hypothetical protein